MLFLNILLSILCVWLIMYLNTNYLKIARLSKVRFKLFNLRDDLAILAMQGNVESNCVEYRTLMDLLNGSISILEKFSIINFLRYLVTMHKDKNIQRKIEQVMQSLGHKNNDYKAIVHKFFEIMHQMLDKHTRFFRVVIFPILLFIFSPFKFLKTPVKNRSDLICEVDLSLEKRMQQAA